MAPAETLTTVRDRMETAPIAAYDVDTLRAKLLHGRVQLPVLAQSLGVTDRTVYGYCEEGLPFIKVDGNRWIGVDEAIEWLTQRRDPRSKSAPEPLPPARPVGRPSRSVSK